MVASTFEYEYCWLFIIIRHDDRAIDVIWRCTRAFAEWAQVRVKSKRGAKLLAAFLGVFIFVDALAE
ncbi:hypothetical protein ACT691_02770 [Vibrio metschnikovii]